MTHLGSSDPLSSRLWETVPLFPYKGVQICLILVYMVINVIRVCYVGSEVKVYF